MIRLLLQNLGWKLFSLLIAVVLWLTFVGSPELVTSVSAPVEYLNVPQDLEIIPDSAERVHLEVRGPSAKIRSFEASGTAVILDLGGVNAPGERTFTINRHQVNMPAGLSLVKAIPAQVRLRFERRISREVPIKVMLSHPAPGYEVTGQHVEPAKATVVGPESRVREMDFVETDPINLSEVVGRQEFQAHLFVRDPQVRLESPVTVRVRVDLQKASDGETTLRD